MYIGFASNTETLSGDKTLVVGDAVIQRLDPDGADRNVNLPAEGLSTNLLFFIYNDANGAGEDLTVKDDTPATIVTLGPGMGMLFTCDGTSWVAIGNDGVVYDAVAGTSTVDELVTDEITAPAASLVIKPTADATDAVQIQDKDGNNILNVDTVNNRVGIGTSAPRTQVEFALSGGPAITLHRTDSISGYGDIQFGGDSAGSYTPGGKIAYASGALSFFTDPSYTNTTDNLSSRFTIKDTGNVGIGTTAPDKQLEVNSATGAVFRGTYNDANGSAANYFDMAVSSGGDLTITPSGGDVNIEGTLTAKVKESIEASTDTLSTTQCYGGLINNYGQAADVTMTLPAAASGMHFTVILGTTVANFFRLDPNGSDLIYLDGIAGANGEYVGVASAAAGNAIQFVAFQTGASEWNWHATTISGAWAAE
jgi:hypothetical protein